MAVRAQFTLWGWCCGCCSVLCPGLLTGKQPHHGRELLSHQGDVQEHLESAFEHWVTSLPTSHCPCGDLGSTTVIQMQTHPASSPANPLIWHCRFGIPEFPLHTCAGISTAIPSTWNSTLGHLVCCPHPLLALLAPPAAITMAGMTQTRQHPTRR